MREPHDRGAGDREGQKEMAVYRAIYMSFWTDPTVEEDFLPEDKYFMLYVLTNPNTNMCGCYQISLKRISDDMGYNREKVEKILARFRDNYRGTVLYDKDTRELFVKNWHKYNWTDSPKLDAVIREGILEVKSNQFRKFLIDLYNNRPTVLDGRSRPIEYEHYVEENPDIQDGQQIQIEIADHSGALVSGQPEPSDSVDFNPPVELASETKKTGGSKKEDSCPYEEIKEMFNEICVSLPKLRQMGKTRKVNVSARWSEYGGNIEIFREVFVNMEMSDFLTGRSSDWSASFDWAMRPSNFIKILEGNYKNKSHANPGQSGGWKVIQDEASGGQL